MSLPESSNSGKIQNVAVGIGPRSGNGCKRQEMQEARLELEMGCPWGSYYHLR